MILDGILGKGSGKLGNSVLAVNCGVQIQRQYNSKVTNPNTERQVLQRSKFKLASQLAAAMSGEIAIPKVKMVSARNQFIKLNMPSMYEGDAGVEVELEKLQLTSGTRSIPSVDDSQYTENHTFQLAGDASEKVDRVVYVIYKKDEDSQLVLEYSTTVEEPGANGKFAFQYQLSVGDYVIYAYGIKDKSVAATIKYADYQISDASDIAALVASRSMSTSDYVFTKTTGLCVQART